MAFKRKRVSAGMSSWGRKGKRSKRVNRFKRKTRRPALSYTSLTTAPRSRLVRARRPNPKRWKRILRNATDACTHYRSALSGTNSISTASRVNSSIIAINLFSLANPFWTSAGGAISQSFAASMPTFTTSTFVIRGGKMFCTINNPVTSTDHVKVRCQLVYPKQQSQQATNASLQTSVPFTDWINSLLGFSFPVNSSPQDFPDYSEYLHPPVMDKEMILQIGETVQFERKLGVKKVDADGFIRGAGSFPRWIILATTLGTSVSQTVNVVDGYDLTFSALPL